MDLYIRPNGEVATLYDELLDLSSLGMMQIARASHVEPDSTGQWFAYLIDGPTLGPFCRRSEALTAEQQWLINHVLNISPSD
ncbi:MAG: hypothetical protein JWP89_6875 [Schlesneria sp.]|nr:hypothetical protein [Schlesneria sp.]